MKDKSLAKVIRHILSAIPMFFVNSIIFLFKNINKSSKLFKFERKSFKKHFREFLEDYKGNIKEGIIALLICACGDLVAGLILGNMTYFLEKYPGLLVLIPGAIGMRGNIFGSFGSRLSTNLHIGILTPEFKKTEALTDNILSSLVLTLVLSLFLAFVAKVLCIILHFESMSFVDFALISIIAGLISNIIMLPITMFISLKSFENGWDPDNITTPIIAAFGDLFTLPAIIISILILSVFSSIMIVKYAVFIIFIIIVVAGFLYGLRESEETKTIIGQSTPVLFVCSILGVVAGGIFNSSLETLLTNPSLLTLLPLFSGESGSLVSILGARISSGLHSGLIEPVLKPKKNTFFNFILILILAIAMYPTIGFLAEATSRIFESQGMGFIKIIEISTLSGLILIPIMMIVVFYISTISYRHNLDPDNIVLPISTSITDSISSLILISISLVLMGSFIL